MKKITFLIFLFSIVTIHSQHQSAKIIYKKTIFNSDKKQLKKIDDLNTSSNKISYVLKISGSNSLFSYSNDLPLEIDEHSLKYLIGRGGSSGNFFTDLNAKSIIRNKEFLDQEFNIKIKLDSINWKLSNEHRMIGNYKCYKATTTKIIKNSRGVFKHPVEAWYTPEIPMNFGPVHFAGLPGLILELSYQDVQFKASEIIVNPKQKIKIPKIPKAKEVTNDEYNEIIKKLISQYRKGLFD